MWWQLCPEASGITPLFTIFIVVARALTRVSFDLNRAAKCGHLIGESDMVLVGCSRPYPKLPPRRPDPSSHVSHKGIYPDIPRTDTAGRMAAPASAYKDRQFIAVIGDEV